MSTILESRPSLPESSSNGGLGLRVLETLLDFLIERIGGLSRLGKSDNSLVSRLQEVLHDRVILLQELFHLLNQVL